MVKSNSYTPTNKYFRNKFQDFASTKTKKGHLDNSDDKEGSKILTGTLVKINKKKLYDDGWLVEVPDKKQYWCSYGDGVIAIPDSTVSAEYYTPKKKIEAEISVDEDNKVYILTRLKDPNKKPLALFSDLLEISTNTNSDTNDKDDAKIQVSKNDISLVGKTIADAFTSQTISVSDTIKTKTAKADETISQAVHTDTMYANEIRLSDDEEPSLRIEDSRLMVGPKISTKNIVVSDTINTHTTTATKTISQSMHTDTMYANEIRLSDDNEPSLKIEDSQLMVNHTVISPQIETNHINSLSMNTNTIHTDEIQLADNTEPSLKIEDSQLMVNHTVVSPELSANHIKTITLQLGDEDLDNRISKLERRIEQLEGA